MTDLYAYIEARAPHLGCMANAFRRRWYRKASLTGMRDVERAELEYERHRAKLDEVDRLPDVEAGLACMLAYEQLTRGVDDSYDEMLDDAALCCDDTEETGAPLSTLAEYLGLAARIWEAER